MFFITTDETDETDFAASSVGFLKGLYRFGFAELKVLKALKGFLIREIRKNLCNGNSICKK